MMLFPFFQISKPQSPPPDRFSICLPYTLAQEQNVEGDWSNPRNYSVDPVPTFNGIEESEFWDYCKLHGIACVPVRQMTQLEGYAIYRASYWLPHCPALPPGLDLQFFDSAVNEGPEEAVKILQRAIGGIAVDGAWGAQTSAAASAIASVPAVVERFTARRVAVYKETKDFNLYGGDWMRRANEIGDEALKMVTT